jgi:hypothetical protein
LSHARGSPAREVQRAQILCRFEAGESVTGVECDAAQRAEMGGQSACRGSCSRPEGWPPLVSVAVTASTMISCVRVISEGSRYGIPADCKLSISRDLISLGVTAETLFRSLDALTTCQHPSASAKS